MTAIKIRFKRVEESILLRLLITHPMETGRRIDPESGKLIPAHYIKQLTVKHEGRVIVSCDLGPGVSSDPYFVFRLKNGKSGDSVTVVWRDNLGNSEELSGIIE